MTFSEHTQCIFLAILKPEFGSFSHVASHHTNYMGLFARQIFCFPTHLPPFILCIISSISLTAVFITSFLRLAPGPAPCNCRHGQLSPQQVPWSPLRSCKERKESCILFSSSPRWGRCCWPSSPYPFFTGANPVPSPYISSGQAPRSGDCQIFLANHTFSPFPATGHC